MYRYCRVNIVEIKTGFGRPKRLGMVKHTTIYLYEVYSDVYEKAVELAKKEGISFSEIISKALAEYVEKHYPGNPQTPLLPMISTAEEYLAECLTRRIESCLSHPHPENVFWLDNMHKLLRKAEKLKNINPKLDDLIVKAKKVLENI